MCATVHWKFVHKFEMFSHYSRGKHVDRPQKVLICQIEMCSTLGEHVCDSKVNHWILLKTVYMHEGLLKGIF